MVEQIDLWIGDVRVPVIDDEEVKYYPISYISEKVLLRSNNIIDKYIKEEFKQYIKDYNIVFGEANTQKAKCISEEGLIRRLQKTHIGRLTVEQRKIQNILHDYLGIDLLSEKESIINLITDEERKNYDNYTIDVIDNFLIKNNAVKFQLCSKCDKYFPLHSKFFHAHYKASTGFAKVCNVCSGLIDYFKHDDIEKNKIIKQAGIDLYNAYMNNKIFDVYLAYYEGKIKNLPDCYENKDCYLKIIKKLLESKLLLVNELNTTILYDKYKLKQIYNFYKTNDLHIDLFGESCIYYPWKYDCLKIGKSGHTFEQAKIIFDNYLKEYNIKIEDIFNFNYSEIMLAARIRTKNILGFIVYYYKYKFAGYKFSTKGKNYFRSDDNIIFDLKYLIEEDMKIEIQKIPLYLTKTILRKTAPTLYNYIILNGNNTLYYYVNKLYPNVFVEFDFDINYYRDEFDSIEESQIHDVLRETLSNVLYNARNTSRTITIQGMQPDWIVIGEEKCWFIEYFGLYSNRGIYNTRTSEYIEKSDRNMNQYNELIHYGKIYLFPEDLDNNFEGIKNKIKIIR